MVLKIIVYGVLVSFVLVLISVAGDFIAIWVGPLFSDTTKKELFDLAMSQLQINRLLSRFLWNLPAGLIISGVTYWYFVGGTKQRKEL